MRKRNTTIFVLLFVCFILKAQIQAKGYTQLLDYATLRVVYQSSQKALKDNDTIIVSDTMTLDAGNKWSVYYDGVRIIRDSLRNLYFQKNPIKSVSLSTEQETLEARLEAKNQIYDIYDDSQGESMSIFKNRSENILVSFDKGPIEGIDTSTNYELTEKISPHNWIITEDTCTLLNYPCNKAVTYFKGRKYVAWFTPEIPINEGPWRLYGLPGLILKVEDEDLLYKIETIGLQKIKSKAIYFPSDNKIRKCTREELIKYRQNSFKNIKVGFNDGKGNYTFYKSKNPITYNELETLY